MARAVKKRRGQIRRAALRSAACAEPHPPRSPSLLRRWAASLLAAALLLPGAALHASPQDDLETIIAQHYPWGESAGPGLLVGVREGDSAVSITQRGYADLDLPLNGEGLPDGEHLPIALFTDIAQYYAAIPEPQTVAMLLTGASLLFAARRRR